MSNLNSKDSTIHSRALSVSKRIRESLKEMVEVLIAVEGAKIHKKLGRSSVFLYATDILQLEESVAYALIAVARKSAVVPSLRKAVAEGKVTPSKASRMVSILNAGNAVELIEFASTHTSQQIDCEIAKRNPKAAAKDRIKPLAEDLFQITVSFDKKTIEMYSRIQSLLAQKGKPCSLSDAIAAAPEYYLNVEDPIRRAERSVKRAQNPKPQANQASKESEASKADGELCLNRVQKITIKRRIPTTAKQNHEVDLRDRGRCRHIDERGKRCDSDRYTHTHHIVEVSMGGSNEPENLLTLCSFHHDQVHQKKLAKELQREWIS